ncbi:MAG: non-hydrolyzing UDP-N-acetylglucosamine 2-epimerase [Mycobacteriales bacterium]
MFGTRPEIVKLSGIVRILGHDAWPVHTGQHYDDELAADLLAELGYPPPAVRLAIGGLDRAAQIGEATAELGRAFLTGHPQAVVVQGDTNSTLAAALAANAAGLPLAHVEAGLRSQDRRMPEEHNRRIVDHLADLCLAPTPGAVANLAAEGITGDRVVLTGNTVVEATRRLLPDADKQAKLQADLGLTPAGYILATLHRPENVDAEPLEFLLAELGSLPLPVVLPLHPRTRLRVRERRLERLLAPLRVLDSMPYGSFLGLAAGAALLVTDSGGLQEEASVLHRPIVVVRRSTERPEVLGPGGILVHPEPGLLTQAVWTIVEDLPAHISRASALRCPFGDGLASERSVAALQELLGSAW